MAISIPGKESIFPTNFWLPFFLAITKKFLKNSIFQTLWCICNTYTEKHVDKVDFDILGSRFTIFQLAPSIFPISVCPETFVQNFCFCNLICHGLLKISMRVTEKGKILLILPHVVLLAWLNILYYYYVGVEHWIGLRSVVKFLEILCQQDYSNLKNILEDPCRI